MNPVKPEDFLSAAFEDLYEQTVIYGLTHEELQAGRRREQLHQIIEWKSKYGFKLNIFANDHLIDGKKHFHFDNNSIGTFNKFDFKENLLDSAGKALSAGVTKELVYFLRSPRIQELLHKRWNDMNPNLTNEY